MDDASRTKYLTPDEAVQYGMIDKVFFIILSPLV